MTAQRLPYAELSVDAYNGFLSSKKALKSGPLDAEILELVNLRVSQINGCAYCTQMHSATLRRAGAKNGKIDSVAGWRVSEHFDARERAALAWADSVTDVAATAAPDDIFEALKDHFDQTEISDLTFAIALMNAFNRLAIGMRL